MKKKKKIATCVAYMITNNTFIKNIPIQVISENSCIFKKISKKIIKKKSLSLMPLFYLVFYRIIDWLDKS